MKHRLGVRPWKWLVVGCWALGIVLCASMAHAQSSNWPSESAPRPLAPKEFTFPPYEIRTLSNGMQVMVILHHEQPAVTMRLLARAGAAQDPEGKRGIAELVAHLLDQGTTTRSAQQIAEQIDFIGGAIGTGSGTDLTYVNAVVMKDIPAHATAVGIPAKVLHDRRDVTEGKNENPADQ